MINNFLSYKKLLLLKTYNKKHFLIQLKKPNKVFTYFQLALPI